MPHTLRRAEGRGRPGATGPGPEGASTKDRRLVFGGLLVTTVFALVAEGVVNVNLMPYAAGLGVSSAGLGVVFTAHRLVRIGATPVVGLAVDRLGRRPSLLAGIVSAAAALAMLAVARDFPTLLVSRALYGLASSLIVTAGLAAVLDVTPAAERGGALGLYHAALWGVYPVGSVLGGFLVDAFGYIPTFLGASGAVLAGTGLAFVTVRETRPRGRSGGAPAAPVSTVRLRDYPRLLTPTVRRFTGLKMLSGFATWGVFEATYVLFLLDLFGPRATIAGGTLGTRSLAGLLMAGLLVIGFLVGSPLVGRWSDRTGRRLPPVVASLALTVMALLGLAAARTAEEVALAMLAIGLSVALVTTPVATAVGDAARPDARAATMAAYATLSDVATSAGSIAGASLALDLGYRRTYVLTALTVAALTPLIARRRRDAGAGPH
jgi:MFS family permease